MAQELTIGNFRLRNVPFLVQADKDSDDDGIIGLPVMLALETVRWGSDGMMDIGFPAGGLNVREANLAFGGDKILTTVGFGKRQLDLHLDTGSDDTRLYPRFDTNTLRFCPAKNRLRRIRGTCCSRKCIC